MNIGTPIKPVWSLTDWTPSQHWMAPVLHWLTEVAVGPGADTVIVVVGVLQRFSISATGVAAARRVNAKNAYRIAG